ncbi:SPX domain-containing protein [Phyllosticta citrichinensis]|uniref:SPX domain-containing protein n=1 Tax=Phyllosticta citrichinensis TaxID=1130410 RepID=A0ABR1XYK6_9PEZI
MKFAKELERELVPEWRAKYLNYKLGKKKLKAISRALRNATQQTPRDPPKRLAHSAPVTSAHALHRADIRNTENSDDTNEDAGAARPRDIPGIGGPREALIKRSEGNDEAPVPLTRYGSILGSPPLRSREGNLSTLALPDPAIDPDHPDPPPNKRRGSSVSPPTTPKRHVPPRQHSNSAIPPPRSHSQGNFKGIFQAKRTYISPVTEGSRVQLKKVLSLGTTAIVQDADVPLEAYKDIDTRQQEFFRFLDQELEKIETFYKEKEDEATKRLVILREQLHSMRDRRLEEITTSRSHRVPVDLRQQAAADALVGPHVENGESESKIWSNPLDAVVQAAKKLPDKIAHSTTPSKASNSIADLGTPRQFHDRRDYTRRQEPTTVPYRTAKRKLKVALQEYYRGLELLKSYALLNRTAFRKINKKYDKTVNARPAMRYMNEKVNKAWFVKSDVIENYIHATEDLYARYFYSGNHKVAIGKLRVKSARAGDYTDSTFRNGIFLATGAVFGIQGLVQASSLARSSDAMLEVHTSFLLQLYAGYFLVLLLFLLFCVDCRLWSTQKINYGFVFEFDSRTQLDWRQLCEIPSFFFFLEGLFMWVNFNRYGGDSLYIYYPVILFFVTLVVMFFPARVLYHHSRKWFAYTLVRPKTLLHGWLLIVSSGAWCWQESIPSSFVISSSATCFAP